MRLAVIVKFLLVVGLLVAGTLCLLWYREFEAHGIPAGMVLLFAGIALAKFWKVCAGSDSSDAEDISELPDGRETTTEPQQTSEQGFESTSDD